MTRTEVPSRLRSPAPNTATAPAGTRRSKITVCVCSATVYVGERTQTVTSPRVGSQTARDLSPRTRLLKGSELQR